VLVEVCPESGGKGFPGVVSQRDAGCRRGWGAEEKAEVSNGVSNGGFEPRTRDTLRGVRKEIPIPYPRLIDGTVNESVSGEYV
jgi:hypothetical protein